MGKFLHATVTKGDTPLSSQPKVIYESNPVLNDCVLDLVCACINFLHAKKGEKVIELGEQRHLRAQT